MTYKKIWKMNHCFACIGILLFVLFCPRASFGYENEIKGLASNLSENIVKAGKKRIAVVDFTDLQGNVTELGRFIAEEFAVALLSAQKDFEIVDRIHLQALIKEHKLSATGLIDPVTAQKLGKIAGVDALVTGTITPFGESVRLSIKILDSNSAKLIGAKVGNIPATEAIKSLLASGIQEGGMVSTKPILKMGTFKAQQVIETEGYSFVLQKCTHSGDSVICYLLITNKSEDRELTFVSDRWGKISRILDNFGAEYYSSSVQLGKQKSSDYVLTKMVSHIPYKANIRFDKISSKTEFLTLVELYFYDEKFFPVQFRNISFSK